MSEGEDWIMIPVLAGACRYESLLDGTLTLLDLAKMNEAIATQSENEIRAQEAMKRRN